MKVLADRLVREADITEEQARELITLIVTDWNSLLRAVDAGGVHQDNVITPSWSASTVSMLRCVAALCNSMLAGRLSLASHRRGARCDHQFAGDRAELSADRDEECPCETRGGRVIRPCPTGGTFPSTYFGVGSTVESERRTHAA
ncbi:hypothetical protein [Mesorhizobium sp.]|uniref:hypothetical protein n=1 Tax=Mesorhizobium sp. TaxID=1871066 RepID=UPI0025DFBE60|nr:hypothetical protein [Mesorhizobium sp.]